MIKKVEGAHGLPDRFMYGNPYNNRPRSDDFYGVTEVLYCIRKAFLQRVVSAPSAIDFSKRVLFSRGHSLESAFFGVDKHNPEYFVGGGDLEGLEGHSDHIVRDYKGDIDEVVEFKSVRRLWYKSPNGKSYYSISMAKKFTDRDDWGKIEHKYNDSHLDQLKTYMCIADAPRGIIIYYELTTDKYYSWTIEREDISDEFKERMASRLKILKHSMDTFTVPEKMSSYDWECNLCNHNSNGICTLCDQEGFDLKSMCDELDEGIIEENFDRVVGRELKKYGIKGGMEGNK